MTARKDHQLIVFGGPSLPNKHEWGAIDLRPPTAHGDFASLIGQRSIVVLLDGEFIYRGAVTHHEIWELLESGVCVIGAASTGALRAVELGGCGMVGVGVVYKALLEEIITDDSELAVGMCPTTYEALSIPLVNIRRFLFGAMTAGLPTNAVEEAWQRAAKIYWLSRTPAELLEVWSRPPTQEIAKMFKSTPSGKWNVKGSDAIAAIHYAQRLAAGSVEPTPTPALNLLTSNLI